MARRCSFIRFRKIFWYVTKRVFVLFCFVLFLILSECLYASRLRIFTCACVFVHDGVRMYVSIFFHTSASTFVAELFYLFLIVFFSFLTLPYDNLQLSDDENNTHHVSTKFNLSGITLQPGESGLLGPIAFNQQSVPSPEERGRTYKSIVENIYILNSFSGVDKLVLTSNSGLPSINLKSVAVETTFPVSGMKFDQQLFHHYSVYQMNRSFIRKNGTNTFSKTYLSVPLEIPDHILRRQAPESPNALSFGSIVEVDLMY